MLVTDFNVKYILSKFMYGLFQLLDVGRMHPGRIRALRALRESVNYIEEHLPDALCFETQRELLAHSLTEVHCTGYFMEFGVFRGQTLRFLASRAAAQQFHGFDSFRGLPEDWGGFGITADAFDRKGRLPRVPANAVLHPGWFHESLPVWLTLHEGPIAYMHVDCDIYSSTKAIFDHVAPRIQTGTVIVFDEYFNYPNWKRHEFRAFQEYVEAHGIRYEYLAHARQQVTVRITHLPKIL